MIPSFIFLLALAKVKICIVPLSLEQAKNFDSLSKLMLNISAFSLPRLNSCTKVPSSTLNNLNIVPLSEAVASNVPS